MRVCQLSVFVVVALIGASQAMAESGLPSQSDLDAMGLAGLQVMSDVEGLSVRGMGFNGVSAYGNSWASVASHGASAGTKNGYNSHGNYLAGGHNESEAELEIEIEISGGHNGGEWGNKSKGGHSNGGHNSGGCGNCSKGGHSKGGHSKGGHDSGGHNSQPKSVNINVNVSAGGSSIAFRK